MKLRIKEFTYIEAIKLFRTGLDGLTIAYDTVKDIHLLHKFSDAKDVDIFFKEFHKKVYRKNFIDVYKIIEKIKDSHESDCI